MTESISQLELLPNEILIHIFQYFNAQELFSIFYNLNTRFNKLLETFDCLKLCFCLKRSNNEQINDEQLYPLYVYTLTIESHRNINLTLFRNIHRLKLEWISHKEFSQFIPNIFPYLEELKLGHIETLPINENLIKLPSLRILKVRFINSLIYQLFLSVFPNLYFFELSIFTTEQTSIHIPKHDKLKCLKIHVGDVVWPWNDEIFHNYLSCLPNLERFTINRSLYVKRINDMFLDYNWLSSIIALHLPNLNRFHFNLRCFQSSDNIFKQIHEKFVNAHCGKYQSRLILEIY